MDTIQAAKKKAKEWKKKQRTPIVGDIGALADTLPTIDLLLKKDTGPKVNRYKVTVKHLYLMVTEFWRYWGIRQRMLKCKSANV